MKKISIFLLSALFVMSIGFNACKQNATNPAGENIKSSEDNALVDSEFSSVFSMVDSQSDALINVINNDPKSSEIQDLTIKKSDLLPQCATLTWDSVTKTLVIDFGTANCLCRDDLWRRGKIIVIYNGKYPEVNSGYTITLENYYVQDMKVYGTKTVTFLALFKVRIKVENAGIVTPTGTIKWECYRTIEKLWGQLTPKTLWDDVYSITGNASGVNREGTAFTVNIDKALKKALICQKKDFISGIITIQNDKGNTLTVDYDANGDEACNKLAKVTVNGVTKIITLR